MHHDRSGYLPKDRTDLYEASCHMLLDSRDREKKVLEADEFRILDYRDKQSLLMDVAQWLSKNEQTSLSPMQLLERFDLKLNDFPDATKQFTARQLKSLFLERSGLLLQVGVTEIQFAHRSFQEFFTAKYLVQERDWETLKQNMANSYWYDTILLAVGLCQSKTENEIFLTALLQQAKQFEIQQNKQNATQLYLLVLHCKEMMRQISPTFSDQLESIILKMLPPVSSTMVDALATSAELALPYLKRPEKQSARADLYSVLTLIKINTLEAYQLLPEYFKQEQSAHTNDLCRVIEKMDKKTAEAAKFSELILADGLTAFADHIRRKLAFLLQDPQLMPTSVITELTTKDFDEWELEQGFAPLIAFNRLQSLHLNRTEIHDLS